MLTCINIKIYFTKKNPENIKKTHAFKSYGKVILHAYKYMLVFTET